MSRLLLVTLMLAAACTAEKPQTEKKPPKVASAPVKEAPPPQLEPHPVEPTPPDPTPTPTLDPAPNTSQWWCLCYSRHGHDAPIPVTACREQESQCRKLEQRVAKGSEEIVAGSLAANCRSVIGTHPSDVAGARDQWEPSELPGAWVSEGQCLLLEAPTEVAETGEPSEPVPTADPFAFMRSELIGDIAIDQESAAIRKRYGVPERSGAVEEMGATGDFEQTWEYVDGLSLIMRSTTRSGPQTVGGVIVVAPSTLITRRGIKIGSDRAAVERAYGDVRDSESEQDPDSFTAGSIYGGLHFSFENDTVTRMFLGAVAE